MKGYFRWLLPALATSVLMIAVSAVAPGWPRWVALAPVVPLVAYHLGYLRPRAASLPSAAVDSVYYFGFLVTVGELAATALELANGPNDGMHAALYNFGAGLLATGYAVLARLHLQNCAVVEGSAGPEEVLDRYLHRSDVFLDNIEEAIRRFDGLAIAAMSASERVTQKAQEDLARSADSLVNTFAAHMQEVLGPLRADVESVRSLVVDANFSAERRALAHEVEASVALFGHLRTSLDSLRGQVASSADCLQRASTGVEALSGSVSELQAGVARVAAEGGPLVRVVAGVERASTQAASTVDFAHRAAVAVEQLSAGVGGSAAVFTSLRSSAEAAERNLASLGAACGRLQSSIAAVEAAVASCDQLSVSVAKLGRDFPTLGGNLQTVSDQLQVLRAALGEAAGSLESDVSRSTRAVGMLAENLSDVAETIVQRTRERTRA